MLAACAFPEPSGNGRKQFDALCAGCHGAAGAGGALDAKTGQSLWHFNANAAWHASPMTYSVDHKQYVSIAAGSNILTFALP